MLRDKLQEGYTCYTVPCMATKCVAALRQSLRKVERDSTSCNASRNAGNLRRNKIARRVGRQVA